MANWQKYLLIGIFASLQACAGQSTKYAQIENTANSMTVQDRHYSQEFTNWFECISHESDTKKRMDC